MNKIKDIGLVILGVGAVCIVLVLVAAKATYTSGNAGSLYEHDSVCSVITKDSGLFPLQYERVADKCEYNELALTLPVLTDPIITQEPDFIYVKPGRSNHYQGPLTDKVYIVTAQFQAEMYGIAADGTQTETIKAFPYPISYGYHEQLELRISRIETPIVTAHISVIPFNHDGLRGETVEFVVDLE